MWAHDLKLGRARKYLEELEAEVERWVHKDGYSIRVYPDPEPPSYVVKAESIQPPAESLALLVGDCLYNARASLEYIAHALGDIGAGGEMTAEQSERSAFPIVGDRDKDGFTGRGPDLFEGVAGRHLATVTPDARAAIKRLQPFYEGDIWEYSNILILNELARLDRHRFPHFGAVRNENVELDRTRSRNIKVEKIEALRGSIIDPDLEDSADLARVTAYPANSNEKMHMHFTNGLAITFATADTVPAVNGEEVEMVMWRAVNGASEAIRALRPFLTEST
jgi:hypothetical protein